MSTISEYIQHLESTERDFSKIVEKILIANQGKILTMLKLRLYNTGLDAKGNLIGHYRAWTIDEKKGKRQRTSFVTLRDTGAFYGGMFVEVAGMDLLIGSTDSKTSIILTRYPNADILGLTQQEQDILVLSIIEPEIIKILNSRQQIDLFD